MEGGNQEIIIYNKMEQEIKTCEYCGVHSVDNSHGTNCRLKEFDLSEKVFKEMGGRRFWVEDKNIKEFIEIIETEVLRNNLSMKKRIEILRKRAGDKLITNTKEDKQNGKI